MEKFGRIDILVNNAGITKDNLIMRMEEEDFKVIEVNLKAPEYKHTSKVMMEQRSGKIINLSVVAIMGNAGQSNCVLLKQVLSSYKNHQES